jgi:hypothetical protein
MTLTLDHPAFALDAGQVVSLDDAQGTRVCARVGTVWITYEDSRKDVILQAGECLTVARGGRTVVQALQPSFLSLQ